MNKKNLIYAAVAAYILTGIATFGNAAVYFERKGEQKVRECEQRDDGRLCGIYAATGTAAAAATLLWPMYWSYRMAQ